MRRLVLAVGFAILPAAPQAQAPGLCDQIVGLYLSSLGIGTDVPPLFMFWEPTGGVDHYSHDENSDYSIELSCVADGSADLLRFSFSWEQDMEIGALTRNSIAMQLLLIPFRTGFGEPTAAVLLAEALEHGRSEFDFAGPYTASVKLDPPESSAGTVMLEIVLD